MSNPLSLPDRDLSAGELFALGLDLVLAEPVSIPSAGYSVVSVDGDIRDNGVPYGPAGRAWRKLGERCCQALAARAGLRLYSKDDPEAGPHFFASVLAQAIDFHFIQGFDLLEEQALKLLGLPIHPTTTPGKVGRYLDSSVMTYFYEATPVKVPVAGKAYTYITVQAAVGDFTEIGRRMDANGNWRKNPALLEARTREQLASWIFDAATISKGGHPRWMREMRVERARQLLSAAMEGHV